MRFKIGSSYFFENQSDYIPHDLDTLILTDEVETYKQVTLFNKKCLIYWNSNLTKQDHIEHILLSSPILAGKFLIPEVAEHFKFTIEDLKTLEPVFNKLDDRHLYQLTIFNFYIENNSFFLTEEQLQEAYRIYKLYRQ